LETRGGQGLVRIGFVGDIMQDLQQAGDDFSLSYEEIAPILQGYDLAVGNLEFPVDPDSVVGPAPGQVRFNGSKSHIRALSRAGIGLVTTANNHSFDMGLKGALSTLGTLRSEGIEAFGTGENPWDLRPKIVEVGTLTVAFVASTFPPNVYQGPDSLPIPWPRDWPINELNFDDWSGP
jgi:poly-gamma-glutamate synthesis protein (capsule biosynthesis protein)